tara:strand:- start:963 stop:1205 length:243 start_codon:yes stop_codon:yes gene_type:complete
MNGSEWLKWHKNDTTYYVVFYRDDFGKSVDVVTNDFARWLEETNKDRVSWEEAEETGDGVKYDADDFWLEDVAVFSREGK